MPSNSTVDLDDPVRRRAVAPQPRPPSLEGGSIIGLRRSEPVGVALALQAPDRDAVDALVEDERTGLDAFSEIEVHNWEFGGRR